MEYTTTIAANQPIAITIGNFDGVHKGHQRLMHQLLETAQKLNSKPVLITFSPHTLMVVRPDIDIRYLTTLEEKLTLTKDYGQISDYIVIKFTPAVAAMSASDFMQYLTTHFSVKGMVIGTNFSLGHNRMGDITFLQHYCQEHNIFVRPIPLEEAERTRISSTRIRALVSEGQISEANELLGHHVTLSDIVRHGTQRGRLLSLPTANLQPDLYDKCINIDFIARLRSEQRFANIEALKSQIATDVQQARQILNRG